MTTTGQLTARRTSYDPPIWRVTYDDGSGAVVEVGSVAECVSHTSHARHWRWGIDAMPLMDRGGGPPSGDAWSREAALQAFKAAFFAWVDDHAHDWPRNRDHIKPCDRW